MPLKTNEDRNQTVYPLWESGKTVDEIALLTGIPRGTVGYYVRKFNRLARTGLSPAIVGKAKKRDASEVFLSFLTKAHFFRSLLEMVNAGDFQKSYYYINTMKLLLELKSYITLDEEETRLLSEALSSFSPKVTSLQQKTATPKHKTIESILRDTKPQTGHAVK
jgi:hypothetical protein